MDVVGRNAVAAQISAALDLVRLAVDFNLI